MEKEILLDTYVLQQDMRVRLPKQILNNLNVVKGETMFNIFINTETSEIILRIAESRKGGNKNA
ncbi:MAG: AbrB/MazE/SpoVT family DNA-binding domain-containing protein [Coprococcus sp.]|nr:AbrB/MazE/SpoVT family DNA-binding domain-containing protein [Coprococcus sp.]